MAVQRVGKSGGKATSSPSLGSSLITKHEVRVVSSTAQRHRIAANCDFIITNRGRKALIRKRKPEKSRLSSALPFSAHADSPPETRPTFSPTREK